MPAAALLVASLGLGGCEAEPEPAPPLPTQCVVDADCESLRDSKGYVESCVEMTCSAQGLCSFVGTPFDGDPCDDGSLCTLGDACQNRLCRGTAVDCDDGDVCTDDSCDASTGECGHTSRENLPCDDGIACTASELCDADGSCVGDTSACECTTDLECAEKPNFNYCAGLFRCDSSFECTIDPETAITCDDSPCTVGSCQPATGACIETPANPGALCVPDDPCEVEGACQAGACVGVPKGCDDANPCTFDSCDEGTCLHQPTQGAPCDDGDPCTDNDGCTAEGSCVGSASICDDDDECTSDSCDAETGECTYALLSETPCDDGNPCFVDEACVEGECLGTPVACGDGNPCTDDACQPVVIGGEFQFECVYTKAAGDCDDGNPCTLNDFCQNAVCQAGAINACDCQVDEDCLPFEDGDLCNGVLECVTDPISQLNNCLVDEATVVACDPTTEPCLVTLCDPTLGECIDTPKQQDLPCDDGDPCSEDGACAGGVCVSQPIDCEDGNACTSNLCVAGTCSNVPLTVGSGEGLFTEAFNGAADGGLPPGWTASTTNEELAWEVDGDDVLLALVGADGTYDYGPAVASAVSPEIGFKGDSVTLTFLLRSGLGEVDCGSDRLEVRVNVYGDSTLVETICEDEEEWTTRTVDLSAFRNVTGRLELRWINDATLNSGAGIRIDDLSVQGEYACDDGKPCTQSEQCLGGACLGVGKECDDGDLCTADTCDAATGACVFTELDPCVCLTVADCPDEGPCLEPACGLGGFCTSTPITGACDDGDACTDEDTCNAGQCEGTPVVCEDGNACTDSSCDPETGCLFANVPMPCDDGDPCTDDDVCTGGACVGAPKDCSSEVDAQCQAFECVDGECVLDYVFISGASLIDEKFEGTPVGDLPGGWTATASGLFWEWGVGLGQGVFGSNGIVASGSPETAPVSLLLQSEPVTLPVDGGELRFNVDFDGVSAGCNVDKLTVLFGPFTITEVCDTTGGYASQIIDISDYAGQTGKLTFQLVLGAAATSTAQVALDNVRLRANYFCDDGDACTVDDKCGSFGCQGTFIPGCN